ncbi:hypothetical protein LDO32_18775 [Luteimonas sp. Y-2-2-4F]|nr:hypothetical protein [Luteimonas sp. Y-2-2-4F]MCD9033760.1 hypothetical protein [Luteimonas sp. Y-2-2-4F]
MATVSAGSGRLHVPLAVQDALRRGRPVEAARLLRKANPGVGPKEARAALADISRAPAGRIEGVAPPAGVGELPTEVAAKLAIGHTREAAQRLRDSQPGLSEDEAREIVERRASPLLQQARAGTIVRGDSGRFGWVGWLLVLVAAGTGLSLWLGGR